MKSQSPFALSRFEYGRTHLYYLPSSIFPILEREKPLFMVGSRGTGKTTLLTALTWREQANNPSLRKHLERCGDRGYVGVYIRMPDSMVTSVETALEHETVTLRASIFAYYVDLLWLEELASVLAEVFAAGARSPTVSSENKVIRAIVEQYSCLSALSESADCRTLRGLARLFHVARLGIERALTIGAGDRRTEVQFPPGQVGEFGRFIAKQFIQLYSEGRLNSSTFFKVCFDEAECLSPFQQRVLNTMVRLSIHPLFFVISYVRSMEEMTTTLMPRISLQNADRDLLFLDEMTDEAFRELSEGVASIRIAHQLNQKRVDFSTRQLLGSLNINALLLGMIRESASKDARSLLAAAEELGTRDTLGGKTDQEAPPIYQSFLLEESGGGLRDSAAEPWRIRAYDSAELRKKMVAAYLLICKRFKFKVKYASADMLFQMSDKCVRDYLAQMNSVFIESKKELRRFLKGPCPIDVQAEALLLASDAKRQFIPESGVSAPEPTELLVDALARLTSALQTDTDTGRSLSSTERGVFTVGFGSSSGNRSIEAQRLIAEAAEAGFLKLFENSSGEWKFRVHCSLAAAYGFSYRGAYYPVSLSAQDLVSLYTEPDANRRRALISHLSGSAAKQSQTLPLFGEGQ